MLKRKSVSTKAHNRVLIMLLATVMLVGLVLTGCAKGKEKASIIGTWEGEFDMTNYMNAMLQEAFEGYVEFDSFAFTVQFEFDKDVVSTTIDKDSFKDALDDGLRDMKKGLKNYLEAYMKEQGVDMSVDELVREETDFSSFDEYAEDSFDKAFNSESFEASLEIEDCEYQLKGNKLYGFITDNKEDEESYVEIELTEDELKLGEIVDDKADDLIKEIFTGMVLERK